MSDMWQEDIGIYRYQSISLWIEWIRLFCRYIFPWYLSIKSVFKSSYWWAELFFDRYAQSFIFHELNALFHWLRHQIKNVYRCNDVQLFAFTWSDNKHFFDADVYIYIYISHKVFVKMFGARDRSQWEQAWGLWITEAYKINKIACAKDRLGKRSTRYEKQKKTQIEN